MPQVTCSRCFRVFEAPQVRPGLAPVCPTCASESPALTPRPMAPPTPRGAPAPRAAPRHTPPPPPPDVPEPADRLEAAETARPAVPRHTPAPRTARAARGGRRWLLPAAAAAAAVAALAVLLLARPAKLPAPAAPTVIEALAARWRAAGGIPAGARGGALADEKVAEEKVAEGRAALAADLPSRRAAALAAFRTAIAADPSRADAVAGWATAFAESAGDAPDGETLSDAHDAIRHVLDRAPRRADLLAAYARLLLLAPSEDNLKEARSAAERAVAADPADPSARLALGLARVEVDPAGAARLLEEAAAAAPGDRRLLSAAARARWRAGDGAGAIALARRRLALDRDHAASLALVAEVEIAFHRWSAARATLERWAAADPLDPRPHVERAKLAYQIEGDLAEARRRLAAAAALARADGFQSARVLAHLSAVERAAGEHAAAARAAAEAVGRVPGSAPARFQDALAAFDRGDAVRLRESAGVLARRAGNVTAQLLAARSAELSGTSAEAIEAYRLLGDLAPRDPAVLLVAGGGLARVGAAGGAMAMAERALRRDPLEAAARRELTEFWEGPAALAEAVRRYEGLGMGEQTAAWTAFAAAAEGAVVLGRAPEAERLAARAAAAAPQRGLPLALLAQIALDRGQARRALPLAEGGVYVDPVDPVVLEVRARTLEGIGKRLEAQGAHRAAANAGPNLATPRLALARLLARAGDAAGARTELEALLAADPDLGEARGLLLELAEAPARAPPRRTAPPRSAPGGSRPPRMARPGGK
jgi:tetratricopeptide (TPR) repeat protein